MKILYIPSGDIANPTCGCAVRSRFIYDALCRLGEVEVYALPALENETIVEKVFRKLTKVVCWPLGKIPEELKGQKFDAVVCRYVLNASRIRAWNLGPCYIDVDDDPLTAFDSVESKRLPRILRPLGRMLAKWGRGYCLKKSQGHWTIDELPNLAKAPSEGYRIDSPRKQQLMTVGLMGYRPNYEGVAWFLEKIWPTIHERFPEMTYKIAGKGLPRAIVEKCCAAPNVEYFGFVEDLDALYAESLAAVAPILSGAGTCIKVMEAALHGRIVFGTPMAFRGYDATLLHGVEMQTPLDVTRALDTLRSLDDDQRREVEAQAMEAARRLNSFENFSETIRSRVVDSGEKRFPSCVEHVEL